MKRQLLIMMHAILVTVGGSVAYSDFSLQFDGINDYIEISDAPELSGYDNNLTVEAWVAPTNISQGPNIISKYLNWNNKDWGMFINPDGLLTFQKEWWSGPGVGNWYVYSSEPVLVNKWNHTAFVFDNDNDILNLYLNGVLVGSRDIAVGLPDTTAVVWIGGSGPFYYQNYGTDMFSGYIDDVRIWDVARTNEEISSNMLSGSITGSENGLVAYWNLNEGSGQWLYDSTPYARNVYLGSTIGYDDNDPAWVTEHSPLVPAPPAVILGSIGLTFSGWLLRRRKML